MSDDDHAEGTCDVCDYTFALVAMLEEEDVRCANPYNDPRDMTFIGGHRGDHTEPSGVR